MSKEETERRGEALCRWSPRAHQRNVPKPTLGGIGARSCRLLREWGKEEGACRKRQEPLQGTKVKTVSSRTIIPIDGLGRNIKGANYYRPLRAGDRGKLEKEETAKERGRNKI